jgi:hypothetical protein
MLRLVAGGGDNSATDAGARASRYIKARAQKLGLSFT